VTALRATVVVAVLTALLGGLGLFAAVPVAAEPARPTNFRSVVDSVDPPTEPVRFEVLGGDAFLRVRADPGTTVLVPGYDSEPYLRIDADGSVWRNERSPAAHINDQRDGTGGEFPEDVDASAPPRWVRVGDGGEVAWHDHRIHWMVPGDPPVDQDGVVQHWTVAVVVNGSEVSVSGRLLYLDDVFPWAVAVLLGTAVVTVAAFGGRRGGAGALLALHGASLAAFGLSAASQASNPPGAGTAALPLALAAAAVALSLVSIVGTASGPGPPLAAVAALAGWGVGRVDVMWRPELPTVVAPWLDRAGTGVVLGIAAGAAVLIVSGRAEGLPLGSPRSHRGRTPR
jgi:hypothetical protein